MANTFAGFPILDLDAVIAMRRKGGGDDDGCLNLENANSFTQHAGRTPSHGWILLSRTSYLALNRYAAQTLVITDGGGATITLKNIYVVGARSPWRGRPADPLSPFLVELTDARGLLKSKIGSTPIYNQYNVLAPAYAGAALTYASYYRQSIPGATTVWTWDTMLQNLWANAGLLGTWPGLPGTYAPVGTPEGWVFNGTPVWDAICDVLEHLGMAVTCDLTLATNPFSVVHVGDADTNFAAQLTASAKVLMEDEDPVSLAAGAVPGHVTVYFHRRNQYAGTESTMTRKNIGGPESEQWFNQTEYTLNVSTGYASPQSWELWDDFTVRFDESSTALAADTTTAATIAAARVADYVSFITRGGNGDMRQVYAGLRAFKTGSLVDAVCYRHHDRRDWVTEIVRDPNGTWAEMECCDVYASSRRPADSTNIQSAVLAPTFPIYPLIEEFLSIPTPIVSAAPGPGSKGIVYGALIQQWRIGGPSINDGDAIWFWDMEGVTALTAQTFVTGRLIGVYTITGTTLPLYSGAAVVGDEIGSLTVSDQVPNTVNIPHVSQLTFDFPSGFQLVNSAGAAIVYMRAASASSSGVVTVGTQTFAGNKTFVGTIQTPGLILKGATSGTVTVTPPAVVTTYGITLPATLPTTNPTVVAISSSGTVTYPEGVSPTTDQLTLGRIASSHEGVLQLYGFTSGALLIKVPATVTDYAFTFPDAAPVVNGAIISVNTDGTTQYHDPINETEASDLTGQTAAVASLITVTVPDDGSAHQYLVGGYITVTAVSLNAITLAVDYTDETSTARTATFFGEGLTTAAVSTVGAFPFPPMTIRAKQNTTITIKTTVTGIGSETYDVGGWVLQLN